MLLENEEYMQINPVQAVRTQIATLVSKKYCYTG